ncbi:MAG: type II secretion system protein [Thermodesulfobacteriota bacterium]
MKKGFTLIEVLVAMSILAVSLVVILQLFSGGLKSSRLSDRYTRGIFYAREKMDEILLAEALSQGVISGEFEDGFKWRSEARRLEIVDTGDAPVPFYAYDIKVEVGWQEGEKEKHFTVSTIKLVAPEGGRI